MDGQRFDHLTRLLGGGGTSRRSVVKGLAAALGNGVLGAFRSNAADARRACIADGRTCYVPRPDLCCSGYCDASLDRRPSVGQCAPCPPGTAAVDGACQPVAAPTVAATCQAHADCGVGLRCCGGTCVDPQTDPDHCGGCGQLCYASPYACQRATCSGGVCAVTPVADGGECVPGDPTYACCGGVCTDLYAPTTCGACGNACAPDRVCCRGQGCYDLQSDPNHCGGCFWRCRPGESCVDGLCVGEATTAGAGCTSDAECGGLRCCGGTCVDPQIDPAHCGDCDRPCAPGQTCAGGSCCLPPGPEAACATDGECCRGGCRDGICCVSPGGTCAGAGECCPDDVPATCTEGTCCSRPRGRCTVDSHCCAVPYAVCGDDGRCCTLPGAACQIDGDCCFGAACVDGTCVADEVAPQACTRHADCGPGLACCGGTCVDAQTDPAHCGGCDRTCGPGEYCVAGTCTPPDAAALTECQAHADCGPAGLCCGNVCVNPQTDPAHCGQCGNLCEDDLATCRYGVCRDGVCATEPAPNGTPCVEGDPNYACCAGACTSLREPANCGGCGYACAAGYACCGGTCADTTSDPRYCGDCQTACGPGETCVAGSCRPAGAPGDSCSETEPCASALTCCAGTCVDTAVHADHCGDCGSACQVYERCEGGVCCGAEGAPCVAHGACCAGYTCDPTQGRCVLTAVAEQPCTTAAECQSGYECCAGRCVDTQTDPAYCGGCEAPPCPQGYACCAGACYNVQSDPERCGACDLTCEVYQACEGGICCGLEGAPCAATEECCASYVCDEGVCATEEPCPDNRPRCNGACCEPGYACCGGICSDVQSDPYNCGNCDVWCRYGSRCDASACDPCTPGGSCSGDRDCCAWEVCDNGTCQHVSNYEDPCTTHDECVGPLRCCGGTCTDISSSSNHCGVCWSECDYSNEICTNASCVPANCPPGYDEQPFCLPEGCRCSGPDGFCGLEGLYGCDLGGDRACCAGYVCQNNYCVPVDSVVECPETAVACGEECCDIETALCTQGEDGVYRCHYWVGSPGVCTSDVQCFDGVCGPEGHCCQPEGWHVACLSDTDCCAGLSCREGSCRPVDEDRCPDGRPYCNGECCPSDYDCCMGVCYEACDPPKVYDEECVCVCPADAIRCGDDCCPAGEACCNDTCVDTAINDEHCGECGNACGARQLCYAGGCCIAATDPTLCASDQDCCSGSCDTSVGACRCAEIGGPCRSGDHCCSGYCNDGVCQAAEEAPCGPDAPCPDGLVCPDGVCVDRCEVPPVVCAEDSECGDERYLRCGIVQSAGICIAYCQSDGDCCPGEVCVRPPQDDLTEEDLPGVCLVPCRPDGSCDYGTCYYVLIEDNPRWEGYCGPTCAPGGPCTPENADLQCCGGELCLADEGGEAYRCCYPAGIPAPCTDDGQCCGEAICGVNRYLHGNNNAASVNNLAPATTCCLPEGADCSSDGECCDGVCGPTGTCEPAAVDLQPVGTCETDAQCAQYGDDYRCCTGYCRNVATDPIHCGDCDTRCPHTDCQAPICQNRTCDVEPLPAGTPCAAGGCVEDGTCNESGVCQGTPVRSGLWCDSGNPCVASWCENGVCATGLPIWNGTPCDDGNPCTTSGVCQDGVCQASSVPNGTPCDGGGCIPNGTCQDGVCVGNGYAIDGSPCDGGGCIEYGVCRSGSCEGSRQICDDEDPCTVGVCGPDGRCEYVSLPDGTPALQSLDTYPDQELICCGGEVVYTRYDSYHCGGFVCGQTCPYGQRCEDSRCVECTPGGSCSYDGQCCVGEVCDNGTCRLSDQCPYGPDTCLEGYVWREAVPGDRVCVTPDVRAQAANDNNQAANRVNPNCVYGPDACLEGYVWREAVPGDHVCVTPEVRAQVTNDNAQAANRVDPLCA